ncbi:hypothetical protein CTAYLR_003453 [Chrysophaeum taylorii]|uniref:Uncharacterized protein n=1 Tax=Chrysophaeum taylorii TaxID=2483200 RepID=A0AAD7U953_9STRA|nr:hypothetical protein CTAYLR_003453 [Chrysophaeum taylorii]
MTEKSKVKEVKVVLLGDTGVGKSSLAQRFVTNNFKPYCETTIGASFMSKIVVVDGKHLKCQIWDTAGQEKYHSLAPMYYRGAAVAILVYDMTSAKSFEKLKEWARELRTQGPTEIILAVAGNKSDLEDRREVDTGVAQTYADDIGAAFFETSAKDDRNVSDLFTAMAGRVPAAASPADGFRIDAHVPRREQTPKRKSCC